jgi:Pyruvate/2-oxoacid:ferredoxin oxidoreductase gamma subunit
MKNTTQPISILLCALGGEGGGVLAEWLADTARRAGYPAQATSIPGVAQRTGATTYYLEFSPVSASELGGRRPVFGLNPLPGRLDLLVSSELLETARQIGNGLASSAHTRVITSSSRTLTTAEKMQMGDGRQDDAALLAIVRQHSQQHHVLDMAQLTRQAGTVVSAVMLGCIAASITALTTVPAWRGTCLKTWCVASPAPPPARPPRPACAASHSGLTRSCASASRPGWSPNCYQPMSKQWPFHAGMARKMLQTFRTTP